MLQNDQITAHPGSTVSVHVVLRPHLKPLLLPLSTNMLQPPFSNLSSDLIDEIVDWVAMLTFSEGVGTLLQVDREFGPRCRSHIFRQLIMRAGRFGTVPTLRRLLETSPHIIPYVREMRIVFQNQVDLWPPKPDPDLNHLVRSLASSPNPPSSLKIMASYNSEYKIQHPHHFTKWLATSFFSSALLELELSGIVNFPLEALRACRSLNSLKVYSVNINTAKPTKECQNTASVVPELESLDFEKSHALLRKISEHCDPQFVSLKKLKILRAYPEDKGQMALLQPILDQVQDTLEELHLEQYRPVSTKGTSSFAVFLLH
jgi:hypothetical protein